MLKLLMILSGIMALMFMPLSVLTYDSMKEYESSILKLMEQEWEQDDISWSREKRASDGGSGCVMCTSSGAISCSPSSDCETCECSCSPGYYRNESSSTLSCKPAKTLSGQITFEGNYGIAADRKSAKDQVDAMFRASGAVDVRVLNVDPGSIIVTYEVIYDISEDNPEEIMRNALDVTCNCSGTTTASPSQPDPGTTSFTPASDPDKSTTEMSDATTPAAAPFAIATSSSKVTVNCSASCGTVVEDNFVCENGSFRGYCDPSTTQCVSDNGDVSCECKSDFTEVNATACVKKLCRNDEDGTCNYPFGWCKDNVCECMWGFEGQYCHEPWKFTLTVVGAGCGLIIVILLIVAVYCSSKAKKSKKKKTSAGGEYANDLTNPFTDFQPRIMRAQVPSRNIYSSVSDGVENGGNATSTFNGRRDSDGANGYTNYGYATVDKTRNGSAKYASPGSNNYF